MSKLRIEIYRAVWSDSIFGLTFHIRRDAFGFALILTWNHSDYSLVLDKEEK